MDASTYGLVGDGAVSLREAILASKPVLCSTFLSNPEVYLSSVPWYSQTAAHRPDPEASNFEDHDLRHPSCSFAARVVPRVNGHGPDRPARISNETF